MPVCVCVYNRPVCSLGRTKDGVRADFSEPHWVYPWSLDASPSVKTVGWQGEIYQQNNELKATVCFSFLVYFRFH